MKNQAEEIIERIKRAESLRYDTDVALALGAEKKHIGPWKARGQIPWERVLKYARKSGVSLDYLVLGRGPMRISASGVSETVEPYNAAQINKTLLADAIAVIDDVLATRGVACSEKRKAQLISLVYRNGIRAQWSVPDRQEIEELIELAMTDK